MTKQELAERFVKACEEVKAIETELNEIDAHFGDADHGLTMAKVANAIEEVMKDPEGTVKELINKCADAVGLLGGGSAIPLWNSFLAGMVDGAPDSDEITIDDIKAIFASGYEMLDFMSGAKVGDKTMMDAVIPASDAIAAFDGDSIAELFSAAASAALKGAEDTKNVVSKFGRAKYYGDKTIGTPDAGALSMATFFKGLAE
ncbi:MAG: dihydroxyacetone kinase subunit L [Lachnospiraceae bacterium]|nr:dihydroxyacetone kinase subunit L [Lachnospiraceae bacterium]